MKPTSTFTIKQGFARHDDRAGNHRALPLTDYFLRSQPDVTVGRTRDRADGLSSRRAFRRMTATMMKKDRPGPLEIIVYGLVIGVTGWSVVELLITLAQTGYGW